MLYSGLFYFVKFKTIVLIYVLRRELPHCTSIGAVHLNEPHSNTSVPCRLSPGMIDIVNSSTVAVAASLIIPALPRLSAGLYSVPHCPVCLFTIRSTPFLCGAVNSV